MYEEEMTAGFALIRMLIESGYPLAAHEALAALTVDLAIIEGVA